MKHASTMTSTSVDQEQPWGEQLEEAFARFQPELLGTLFYLVGNHEDARDALQEAFIKCWKHQHELPQIQNLKAWIFQIALNTGRDIRTTAWRRKRVSISDREAMLSSNTNEPTTDLEQKEQLEQLRTAMMQLRQEEKEVFLLRQNGDLTYDQIAESIGIPVGTVKTRMRLALSKLRLAVQAHES